MNLFWLGVVGFRLAFALHEIINGLCGGRRGLFCRFFGGGLCFLGRGLFFCVIPANAGKARKVYAGKTKDE